MKVKKTIIEIKQIINDPEAIYAHIKGKTYVQSGGHTWKLESLMLPNQKKEEKA